MLKGKRLIFITILGLVTLFSSCSIRYMTSLFFGINIAPVNLSLKSTYNSRKSDKKTRVVVAAAKTFLTSLDEKQKQSAIYSFYDNVQRSNWSNFPEGMIPRGGLAMRKLSKKQRTFLNKLLSEIMSEEGMKNLNYQLAAEDNIPQSSLLKYGSKYFYVAFLGEPSNNYPWMFQFGGHHLGINVTIYGADITFSPMLTGGEPIHINYKGQDIYITQKEASSAQFFLNSLTKKQKMIAVCGKRAIDILSGPGEYGKVISPEGIKGSDLTSKQKRLLLEVIKARLGFINKDDYTAKISIIRAELNDTYFGWWGPQDKLGFAYFRITGPSIILEYAPQDDEDSSLITHVHSMYRNPKNDYGFMWISSKSINNSSITENQIQKFTVRTEK